MPLQVFFDCSLYWLVLIVLDVVTIEEDAVAVYYTSSVVVRSNCHIPGRSVLAIWMSSLCKQCQQLAIAVLHMWDVSHMNHSIWLCGIFSTHTHTSTDFKVQVVHLVHVVHLLHNFNLTQGCEFWASLAAYLPGDPQGGLENDHLRPGAKQLWSDCFKITSEVTIVMVKVIIAIEIAIISSAGLTRRAPAAAHLNLFLLQVEKSWAKATHKNCITSTQLVLDSGFVNPIWIVRFTPEGEKEYGLYSPTSVHPPPCTYTYLVTRAPPRTASCRGSSLCDFQKNCLQQKGQRLNLVWFSRPPLGKNSPSESFGFGLPRATASCGETQYTHATLLRGGPWIYYFVPAGSGTYIHHDTTHRQSAPRPPILLLVVEIFPGGVHVV